MGGDLYVEVSNFWLTDYGYFRRHDDVLKRLPCLQLKFQSSLIVGMKADFEAQHDCTRKFHAVSDRHDDGFQHPAWTSHKKTLLD